MTLEEPQWVTEWAVEVTWADWQAAGAKGPTSQYGPFSTEEHRDAFLKQQRRDRDILATRVLTRRAAYTEWEGPGPIPTTPEERERLLAEVYAELRFTPYLPNENSEKQ